MPAKRPLTVGLIGLSVLAAGSIITLTTAMAIGPTLNIVDSSPAVATATLQKVNSSDTNWGAACDPDGKPVAMDVDSEHEFKIVKMNQEEKKVGLSIRAVGEEASRAEVESYKEHASKGNKGDKGQSSSGSSSSSTTLGDLLNWKRENQ